MGIFDMKARLRLHSSGDNVVESMEWWSKSWEARKFFPDEHEQFRAAWSYMSTLNSPRPVYDTAYWEMVGDIVDVVHGTPHWEKRNDILWYVGLCERAGFASNKSQRQNCALRYMAGKRKVSPPGTKRRKRSLQEQRKMLKNMPPELIAAIDSACQSDLAKQVLGGNAKAMNALIGSILKAHKAPAAIVKQLLEAKLKEQA
jgi:hypothetical protein